MLTRWVMAEYFVPYRRKRPASVSVNGHRLIILSQSRDTAEDVLPFVGGDSVKRLRSGDSEAEEAAALMQLGKRIRGGVVIAPANTNMFDVLRDLRGNLPWVQ